MTGTDELVTALEGVDGWLTGVEATALYELAREARGGAIVEIGSWKGRSTIALALGARDGGRGAHVYAVDPHTGSPEHREMFDRVDTLEAFRRNIDAAGVSDIVTPLVLSSLDAARGFEGPVEMLFIDGDHSYEAARADFEAWFPKVVDGGIVAFHDSFVYQGGPRRVIRRHVLRHVRDVRFAYSVFYARKADAPKLRDRGRAWAALVERNLRERYHLRRRFRTG